MLTFYILLATFFLAISAVLIVAPHLRLLNMVDYGHGNAVIALNSYAAKRMLLPAAVNLACAFIAERHPALSVPLIVLTPLSVLAAVVWIIRGAPAQR